MPAIEGVNHIALTVSDLEASAAWYQRLFDGQVLMEQHEETYDRVTLLVPPLVIGLTKHKETIESDWFNEARVGLDHVSFGVLDRASLDAWAARLDELDISHSPLVDAGYGHVLVLRDPDNIQLEFFALPG